MSHLRGSGAATELSGLFDIQASDARLEQLARMTASRYWKQPEDEDWARSATFLFRTGGVYVYCVLPVFRRRYWAVVRVRKEDIPPGQERLDREDVQVRSVSVMELDALKLASSDLMEEP